jgi:O-antigen/teichoic acid export membrane protein
VNLKHSFVSVAGVVSSQATNFLSILLIGKLCGPAALGQFSQLTAVALFVGSIVGLRLEFACMASDRESAVRAFASSTVVAFAISCAGATAAFVAGQFDYVCAVALAFGAFLQQALGAALTSERKYTTIAILRVFPNAAFIVYLAILAALARSECEGSDIFATYGLIFVVSSIVPAVVYLIDGHKAIPDGIVKFSPIQLRYARFGFPITSLNSIVIYSTAIVMPMLFGNRQAGIFALAYRVGYFPASLMAQSLGAVFRRDLIDFHESLRSGGATRNPTRAFLFLLTPISAGLVAACYAGLSLIVHLKMGDQWDGSLSTYLVLLPYFILMSIYASMAQVFIVFNRQKIELIIQACNAAIILAIFALVALMHIRFFYATMLLSASGAIVSLMGISWALGVGELRKGHPPDLPAAGSSGVGDAKA